MMYTSRSEGKWYCTLVQLFLEKSFTDPDSARFPRGLAVIECADDRNNISSNIIVFEIVMMIVLLIG